MSPKRCSGTRGLKGPELVLLLVDRDRALAVGEIGRGEVLEQAVGHHLVDVLDVVGGLLVESHEASSHLGAATVHLVGNLVQHRGDLEPQSIDVSIAH